MRALCLGMRRRGVPLLAVPAGHDSRCVAVRLYPWAAATSSDTHQLLRAVTVRVLTSTTTRTHYVYVGRGVCEPLTLYFVLAHTNPRKLSAAVGFAVVDRPCACYRKLVLRGCAR